MKSSIKNTALLVLMSGALISSPALAETVEGNASQQAGNASAVQSENKSSILRKIVIMGNGRLSEVAIVALMSFRVGDEITKSDESSIVKELHQSAKFSSVKAILKKDVLTIIVVENAIINNFEFKGNKAIKTAELLKVVGVKVRSVSTRASQGAIVSNLREFYKIRGFYHAKVKADIKKLSNNRIDYVFTIEEGKLSTIKTIEFVGNKTFDDGDLRDVALSKEDAWYRFLSDDDIYDENRLKADKQLLADFYRNRGFVDFKVKGVKTILSKDKKDFTLKFEVEEGKRYRLGDFKIKGWLKGMDKERLNALLTGGDKYGFYYAKGLQKSIVNITRELSKQGFSFTEINPVLKPSVNAKGEAVMNIYFEFKKSRRVFVERIVIRGNTRTLDSVVRRELELVEGDPFNPALMRQSEKNIRELRFFSNVSVKFVKGSTDKKVVVYVDVSEQTTGALTFGAGYSNSNGIGFKISASEDNFLGKGQKAKINLAKNGKDISLDVGFTEPRFMGRDAAASLTAKHILYDKITASGYKAKEISLGASLSYDLNEKWSQSIGAKVRSYKTFDIRSNAVSSVVAEAGSAVGTDLNFGLLYSDLDDILNPTKGQNVELKIAANSAGSKYKNNSLSVKATYLYPINEKIGLKLTGEVNKIDGYKQLRLADRLFINTDQIRGFNKVGAIDTVTGTLLGGTQRATVGADVTFPVGLPASMGVKGSLFAGATKLSGTPAVAAGVKLAGENVVRSSAGLGLKWQSPIGAMRFDFVKVLKKADTDTTRTFQFTIGFGI